MVLSQLKKVQVLMFLVRKEFPAVKILFVGTRWVDVEICGKREEFHYGPLSRLKQQKCFASVNFLPNYRLKVLKYERLKFILEN